MEKIEIGQLDKKLIELFFRVTSSQKGVILTIQGKPLVKVLPVSGGEEQNLPGKLAHTLVHEEDIISPLGEEEWEAAGIPT